jgi:hypothetical protein
VVQQKRFEEFLRRRLTMDAWWVVVVVLLVVKASLYAGTAQVIANGSPEPSTYQPFLSDEEAPVVSRLDDHAHDYSWLPKSCIAGSLQLSFSSGPRSKTKTAANYYRVG